MLLLIRLAAEIQPHLLVALGYLQVGEELQKPSGLPGNLAINVDLFHH